jgi:hypothetical protein
LTEMVTLRWFYLAMWSMFIPIWLRMYHDIHKWSYCQANGLFESYSWLLSQNEIMKIFVASTHRLCTDYARVLHNNTAKGISSALAKMTWNAAWNTCLIMMFLDN